MEEIQKINIEGYEIGIYSIEYLEKIKRLYGFIYVTTNLVNGKMYVGQKKMRVDWKTYLGSGHAFKKAVKKYGRENFERKIIDIAFNADELNYLERMYTKMFDVMNKREWYNICYGGRQGASEYHKKPLKLFDINGNLIQRYDSLSAATKDTGESRDVIRNSCNGKTVMTQQKHIWRWEEDDFNKYPTGRTKDKRSQKIKCYSFNGDFIEMYDSFHEAERLTGVLRAGIKLCCDGIHSTSGGYVWRYVDDDFDKYPVKTTAENIKSKLEKYAFKIKCYSVDGALLKIYDSLHDAEKYTGVARANISRCCKGESYYAGDYVWRYIDDEFDKFPYRAFKTGKVYRYDLKKQLIEIYPNVNQASLLTGYTRSSISRCCNKQMKTAYGSLWFYEDDPDRPQN